MTIFLSLFQTTGFSQIKYTFQDPKFSFQLSENWRKYDKLDLLQYGKFLRIRNDTIGGILRIVQDTYRGINSIWDTNEKVEKELLEREAELENFKFEKLILNNKKAIKILFTTRIGNSTKSQKFEGVIYKFIIAEGEAKYVINFFLITNEQNIKEDHDDLLKLLSTLNII
jgi:hypothetical protein